MTIEERLEAVEEMLNLILNRLPVNEQENLSIAKACKKLGIGRRRFISLVLKYKLPIEIGRKDGANPTVSPENFEKLQSILRALAR